MTAVVVTGAASGIGMAIARRMVRDHSAVVLVDRDADRLADVASALGGSTITVAGDVRDRATHDLAAAAALELGGLRGWVNCAGVSRPTPLLECTDADVHDIVDANFGGSLWGCAAAVRALLAEGRPGAIVNVSSVHGRRAYPDHALYEASKAAIEALTRSVGVTYAGDGIRCNAVAPGGVATPALQASISSAADPDGALAELLTEIPVGRLAAVDEIAEVVHFLLSDASAYVTAQTIVADGAMTSHLGFRTDPLTRRSE
jgi:NAD(P)-dependent dehydrogenase (short-subunit alcohol dehydrogenase family)